MTELLYDQNAYTALFEGTVLSCEKTKDGFAVILDRTAFFPEQGGQYADEGSIGGLAVTDVRIREGIVYHTVGQPLPIGKTVACALDFAKRYDRMQNHSGEHILSGYFYRTYGYENVGFHLNDDFLTLDTSGELSKAQLDAAEDYANRVIMRNLPIVVTYPGMSELEKTDYRSKLELTENVRIVTIPDVDICACCAPHVAATGEIGMIKIVDAIRYKGGMRLTVLCGARALRDYRAKHDELSATAIALSVKQDEVAGGVARLQTQITELKNELITVKREWIRLKIDAIPQTAGNLCLFAAGCDNNTLRAIVNAGLEKCGGICAAFSGDDATGYLFVIGAKDVPLRARAKEIVAALNGRGGGSDTMISGSATANAAVIRAYIDAFR